ncbi:glutathione S-transferase N-terminal domain-containing protein [Thermaurantiacus sp.]
MTVRLFGTEPSFYTRKAFLSLTWAGLAFEDRLKTMANKAAVEEGAGGYHRFPVLDPGEGPFIIDSTRIGIWAGEQAPDRALLPADPAFRILVRMAEDWMDEWFLRAALLFRATSAGTRAFVARVGAMNLLGLRQGEATDAETESRMARLVPGIERFFLESCATNGVTGDGVAATRALLDGSAAALKKMLRPFLFGARPSLPDMALWGFLDAGLLWEPEARSWTKANAPHLLEFHDRLGVAARQRAPAGDWPDLAEGAAMVAPLLSGKAFGFQAFLDANRAALAAGDKRLVLDGVEVPARGFTEKCRRDVEAEIADLTPADRARLAATVGDWPLFRSYRGA